MITLTLIRHGESKDNLCSVWAGWKDASLSNHGMNQARTLGTALANVHFSTIYSSTLKRAVLTAEAVQRAQPGVRLPLITSLLMKEQHFGIAEGEPYRQVRRPGLSLEEHYARGLFPATRDRTVAFPEGESLEDVATRAEQVIDEIVIPELLQAVEAKQDVVHVAVVSHGLFLAELVAALVRRGGESTLALEYRGLLNTAWTRVTHVNEYQHLQGLTRQKGGIGSATYDPTQKDIRTFFGGGSS